MFGDVERGCGVVAELGEREHVDRVVELAVAAAVEAVAVGASGADGDWGAAGGAGELRVGVKAVDPGDLADQLRGDDHAETAFGEELWREFVTSRRVRRELGDRAGQVADPA